MPVRKVQVARRLVAQEQRRVLCQRAGNGDPLLFPARQPAGKMIRAFRQAHLVEQLYGPRGDALGVALDQLQGELDILGGRERRNEVEELEDEPHPLAPVARQLAVREATEVLAVNFYLPVRRGIEATEQVEQRGLAGAARSENDQEFAGLRCRG